MIKHLNLGSMLSGFNVQLSQPMGGASNKVYLCLSQKLCATGGRVLKKKSTSGWDNYTPVLQKKQAKTIKF